MTTFKQDMDDLFSMLHDFEIVYMKLENTALTITMNSPWGELWDEKDFRIVLELYGCDQVTCEYAEINGTRATTNDCKLISGLGLAIQHYKFYPPDMYEFFCETHKNSQIAGGQIKFTANNFKLFDREHNFLSLGKMKELATMWWNSIQKMWDNQENQNSR